MNDKKNTILVVDQDIQVQKMLGFILDDTAFNVIACDSGRQAIRLCISTKPDLILLALDLPDIDGKDVITQLREWSHIPIIVLSERTQDDEIAKALNLGANDYITKPFNSHVLVARLYAALRSAAVFETGETELVNGPVRINLVRHEVFVHDELKSFTPKEYDLLRHLMVNRGKMMTHKEILKKVWGAAHGEDVTYLRVYIGQIRNKIEKEKSRPALIITEPGIGYRMETLVS